MWLNLVLNDCHFGNIEKLEKIKLPHVDKKQCWQVVQGIEEV
jgi:hypothetical protein